LIGEEHGKNFNTMLFESSTRDRKCGVRCGAPELLKGKSTAPTLAPALNALERNSNRWAWLRVITTVFNFPAMVPLWMYPMAIVLR